MGLDSVELVMSFEEYFSVTVPDQEIEQVCTIRDMVQVVSAHKGIDNDGNSLQEDMLTRILNYLESDRDAFVFQAFHPSDKAFWEGIMNRVGLSIPMPSLQVSEERERGIRRIFKRILGPPGYDWRTITTERLAEVVCFANYKELVDPAYLKSKYDIYIAVSGITGDLMGIDYYEILPDKSFAGDFHIN